MALKQLTTQLLCKEAMSFAVQESLHDEPCLYGITDGKAVGTYFEHKFQDHLKKLYKYEQGSSAKGIDFPELNGISVESKIQLPQQNLPLSSI